MAVVALQDRDSDTDADEPSLKHVYCFWSVFFFSGKHESAFVARAYVRMEVGFELIVVVDGAPSQWDAVGHLINRCPKQPLFNHSLATVTSIWSGKSATVIVSCICAMQESSNISWSWFLRMRETVKFNNTTGLIQALLYLKDNYPS